MTKITTVMTKTTMMTMRTMIMLLMTVTTMHGMMTSEMTWTVGMITKVMTTRWTKFNIPRGSFFKWIFYRECRNFSVINSRRGCLAVINVLAQLLLTAITVDDYLIAAKFIICANIGDEAVYFCIGEDFIDASTMLQ